MWFAIHNPHRKYDPPIQSRKLITRVAGRAFSFIFCELDGNRGRASCSPISFSPRFAGIRCISN